jgi:hypothetical protein
MVIAGHSTTTLSGGLAKVAYPATMRHGIVNATAFETVSPFERPLRRPLKAEHP